MSMEDFISEQAAALGFAASGIAQAGVTMSFARYRQWLDAGMHASMSYLERRAPERETLHSLLPEACSIVVVAARYPSRKENSWYSSHAQGRDYHDVLRVRLNALAELIAAYAGRPVRSRICVDTAPLLEREWAVRAGLGWLGRQNSIVIPGAGCCVFLGALLLELDLEPSPVRDAQCGDCRLCVDACPVNAIRPDGFLDARLCRAYLSIEHKGALSPKSGASLAGTVYGCDACTAVCPWNQKGEDLVLPEFKPIAGLPDPDQIISLSTADFDCAFMGTSIHRIGLERLRRNARAVRLTGIDQHVVR